MAMLETVSILLAWMLSPASCQNGIMPSASGYRLPTQATYLILAPRTVRPNMEYQLRVSIFKLYSSSVRVRAYLSREGEEYASAHTDFNDMGTKELSLDVPDNIKPGAHRLVVEGLVGSEQGQPVFFNETGIDFDPKYVSLFIQTDKPMYYPPQQVLFRVVGVTPDLQPMFGTMTVYLVDAGGNIVRRWLQQQLNMGVFHGKFQLSYPVKPGTWTLRVDAFGHTYEQNFHVEFFYHGDGLKRLEINMTTPLYIMDSEYGVVGHVYGEHLSGIASTGNVTVKLQVRDGQGNFRPGEISKARNFISGIQPFAFAMSEMTSLWGPLAHLELYFTASVSDWFYNETETGYSVTKVIQDGVKVKALGRKFRTFKPDVPFNVYFAVERHDHTIYQGRYDRQVVVQRIHEGATTLIFPEEKLIIPDDGIVHYQVTPTKQDTRLILRVWHSSSPSSQEEVIAYRYYSPTDTYISITTSTEQPRVNSYMVFTVRTSVYVEEIHYLIVAGGRVLLGNTLQMASQQKTFAVALSRPMAPRARLVTYFMNAGEVIIDSLTFQITDTRIQKASIEVNLGKDFSWDTLELVCRSDPGAFMFLDGVDYEMYHRGAATFIDEQRIVRELETYDGMNQPVHQHVWWHNDDRWDSSVYYPAQTDGIDAITTINSSGILALSDRNLTLQPDWYGQVTMCNKTLGHGLCPNGQCFDLDKTCDGIVDCADGYDEAICAMEDPVQYRPPDVHNLGRMSRYFSDVDWLWKTRYIMPNGRGELTVSVPETTNPYVISGFSLHPEEGLAIVQQPAMVDVTRIFFITSEAPPNCKRGEQIGIRIGVFNFHSERIEIILTLHGDPLYRMVMVQDFGYVSSYAPKLSGGDHQIMVMLESGETRYVHFPVVSVLETGEFTVRVSAVSIIDKDTEEITISVSMDGVTNGDHSPYLIDLVNQGSVIIPDFQIPIPEQFVFPEQPEHLYVPGSEEAVFQFFGDIVTPGFYESHFDTNGVVGVPHDSADGYMFDFAINLQTLRHLQATSALTVEATVTVLEYMKDLLMRQYAYMQDDGSFKMFRRQSQSCVWTSAFIARVLHDALKSEWSEELYIPVELLNKITLWLIDQQDAETGYFAETAGVLYDRTMNPITVDAQGVEHTWHVPLTAYVVITLGTNTRITGDAKTRGDAAKILAAEYIANKLLYLTDPYQVAIVAYALTVADHSDKDDAYAILTSMRIEGEYIYWAAQPIAPNPTEIINTVPIMFPRGYFENEGSAVTATSYALMLYLNRNLFQEATPIMKWLQTQRNGLMRFSSTQDTLVALTALAEYALRETNRDIYRMLVKVQSTSTPGWQREMYINQSNFASLFEGSIPNAYGQMKATAQGTGYALLQMDFGQNVEKEWQVSGPEFESYDVQVPSIRFHGRNSSIMDATLCVRWVRPDIAPVTGMSVVTLNIPTGFVVSRKSIDTIYDAEYPRLRRVRFREETLIFIWENMTTDEHCVDFRADRWYPVANVSIEHALNAYEYAETGLQRYTLYNTYTLFHQHICQVCGSYQCPYCPFYNIAASHFVSLLPILLINILLTSVLYSLCDIW